MCAFWRSRDRPLLVEFALGTDHARGHRVFSKRGIWPIQWPNLRIDCKAAMVETPRAVRARSGSGATTTRVVTASCPLCSNSDGWLDHHYWGRIAAIRYRSASTRSIFDIVARPICQDGARHEVNEMIRPWRE